MDLAPRVKKKGIPKNALRNNYNTVISLPTNKRGLRVGQQIKVPCAS